MQQVNSAVSDTPRARLAAYRADLARATLHYVHVLNQATYCRTSENPEGYAFAASLESEAERLYRGIQHLRAKVAGLQREIAG